MCFCCLKTSRRYEFAPDISMPVSQLIFEQAQLTLEGLADAEVIVADGEADPLLAQLVISGKAYAVLSSDSDFAAVAGCRWMPLRNFDIDNVFFKKIRIIFF